MFSMIIRKTFESVECFARCKAESVKMQSLLENFKLQVCLSNSPLRCPPGPQRAISAGQLQELQAFFSPILESRDMYWLCDEVVKPLTVEKRISYAELVGCGYVAWFISHWWGMPFSMTVASITKHAQRMSSSWAHERYWICTFSNNQWAMDEEIPPGAPPSGSSFYKTLRSPYCRGN